MTARKRRIREELKQTKPFQNVAEEACLSISRTADVISQRYEQFLKSWEISGTQYNVLRILRGAGAEGLRCGEIGTRMVKHDPDITRLLDRMEKAGWIERARDTKDRRVILTRISSQGLQLLKQIDKPIEELNEQIAKPLSDKKMLRLIDTLDELRSVVTEE